MVRIVSIAQDVSKCENHAKQVIKGAPYPTQQKREIIIIDRGI